MMHISPPPPPRPIAFDLAAEKRRTAAEKRKHKKDMEGEVRAYREQLWLREHGGFNPDPFPISVSQNLRAYLVEKDMLDPGTNIPLLEPLEPPKRRRTWMRG